MSMMNAIVGEVARRAARAVAGLLDNVPDEGAELLGEIAKKVAEAPPEQRVDLLRKAALAVGYERLAETAMDKALKAAKKLDDET